MKDLTNVSDGLSSSDAASKVAETYRLEMERSYPNYEFHTTTLVSSKGKFADMVQQTYACGAQDEPMIIVKTPEISRVKFDIVMATLAIKRRRSQIDIGIKANKSEIDRTISEIIKEIIESKTNTRSRTENLTLLNKILLEAERRVIELLPDLKFGFFIALTTPTTIFEVGQADTQGSDILRIETRVANEHFSILAATLIFPNS